MGIALRLGCCVQSLSRVRLFGTPWAAACRASLSFTISQSLLTLIESVMPSNGLVLSFIQLPEAECPRVTEKSKDICE